MTAGHGDDHLAVGGPVRHIPVLLAEVLKALHPQPGDVVVDGTFGAGGYTRAILAAGASVVAIDRDPDAIAAGRELEAQSSGKLRLVQAPFSSLDEHVELVDGVVLDIGVSSMQLDQAQRGFSFGFLGEERHAGRIARMIESRRERRPFERTLDLADAIETHIGRAPKDKIHPATRVFQALRIYVNDELGELARALFAAERALKPGGRLVVVTFHSLEDRIVKRFITDRSSSPSRSRYMPELETIATTFDKAGGAVGPSDAETAINPRSRSAKLRAAVRTTAAPRAEDFSIFGLPKLPDVSQSGER
jgi:16S rRNA (cytosine1402-N4)-methyltransferase